MNEYLEFYQNLAIAIIVETCRDYKYGKLHYQEFYNFCKSKWCATLLALIGCKDFDGEELYKRMRKEKEDAIRSKT